jgi:fibronectin type 3 domain-containing protein
VVRAVASLEPIVESASSEEACVAVADIAPPATPAGLSILAAVEGIELTWSPSSEADLAGYRVLRSAPGGGAEPIAEVAPKETQFLDKSAIRGLRYRYRIVAFDHAGNASAPSEPAEGELR